MLTILLIIVIATQTMSVDHYIVFFLKVFTVLLIRDSITKHMNLLIHSWCDIAWNRVGTVIGR